MLTLPISLQKLCSRVPFGTKYLCDLGNVNVSALELKFFIGERNADEKIQVLI